MDIKQRIKQMIVERLFLPVQPSQIGDDEPLMEAHGVDSVALFELAVGLEEEFNIPMDDANFSVESFRSVNTIAALVESKTKP